MQTHIDGPVLLVLQRPVAEDFMVVLNAGCVLGWGPVGRVGPKHLARA